jgi:hypothetical protein
MTKLKNKNNRICYEIDSNQTPEFKALAQKYVDVFINKFWKNIWPEREIYNLSSRADLNE